jgi:hypothetical protein
LNREKKFFIATKKDLSKELLEQKFFQYFDSETFPIKKAVKIIYDNIQFEGLVQSSDFNFDYYFTKILKKTYGFEEFFESIENEGFKYFYPGALYEGDEWLIEWLFDIRMKDDEFQLYISGSQI